MLWKRNFGWLILVGFLLAVTLLVQSAPVATTPKTTPTTLLSFKEAATLEEGSKNEEATTPKENLLATGKASSVTTRGTTETGILSNPIARSAATKSGGPTFNTGKKPDEPTNAPNAPSPGPKVEQTPFKPSPQIRDDFTLVSAVTEPPHRLSTNAEHTLSTTQHPTHALPKSGKNPSLTHTTRTYIVRPRSNCNTQKDHDIKIHVGAGRYINLRISED